MKRIIVIIAAAALLAGCNNEKMITVGGPREFTIVSAGVNVDTKTYIPNPNPVETPTADAGKIVYWKQGDAVGIYDSELHDFYCNDNGGVVSIRGEVAEGFSGTYYGLYPYSSIEDFSNGIFASDIPTNQYVADGENWDPKAPVVVGSCAYTDTCITFYNANALLEVYLPAPATQISVRLYTDDHVLSGSVNIDVPSLGVTSGSGYTYDIVTLTGNFEARTPYFIAVTPTQTSATDGFSVYVTYPNDFTVGDKTFSAGVRSYKNKSTRVAFQRDKITVLDLTDIEPFNPDPERALTVKPHLDPGIYLFRAADGSCDFTSLANGADKLKWMDAKIFDPEGNGPIALDTTEADGYQINQSGWHQPAYHRNIDGVDCYIMQICGQGLPYDGYYLTYDPVLQGFKMISNPEDATIIYVYYIGPVTTN